MAKNSNPKTLREGLSSEEKRVMFEGGTEAPFSGALDLEFSDGVYYCNNCHARLFTSDTKFDSGCGWPSFTEPSDAKNVELLDDYSFGMYRVEAKCANCGAHLGHVFDDGPSDRGGKRYCINSVSLSFNRT